MVEIISNPGGSDNVLSLEYTAPRSVHTYLGKCIMCVLTLEGHLPVLLSAHSVGQNYYLLCKN